MIIIVFVALLLFGGEKLPEIARGLGKGIRDFKDASEGVKREINNQINSYEENKEDKKIADAVVANQLSAHNDVADPVTENVVETHPIVPNTIPFNENHVNGNEGAAAENVTIVHTEPIVENHNAMVHVDGDTKTSEPIKNS